ncbi:MAG: sulfide/dihydroorotate dehydrogenase-like FAD/NAD-binding protein, partial [Candidatus Latescibacteria bacterium]|nr:sulfide/dihydroorotate dehydrogenase-like FAD/NAD-binding protein [Candidatus Latescibacterota bacterium]
MYPIVRKERLAPEVLLLEVEAPQIARKAKAGQFMILRVDDSGERIPLTLADWDAERGTITLIFQEVGASTKKLGLLNEGEAILDCVGPLGHASEIREYGTVVCIGGGIGIAPIYPVARAQRQAGNRVISILGARTKELLFWEDKLRAVSNEVLVTTDDGSYQRKGFVTDVLKHLVDEGEQVEIVYAIGPVVMMRAVSHLTMGYGIHTVVSLNPIMMDGTGMCGACRVTVDGETKFACVD